MEKLTKILNFGNGIPYLKDVLLLLMRLTLAYGFWSPAIMKWQSLEGTASWFDSMGYPLPFIAAVLAALTEISGIILLSIGFGSRLIAVPMIFVMLVAILTVHKGNGFDAGDNGFEIPLYYILMLMVIIGFGPGKFSLDNLMSKR